jgi:hypothetical protein
MATNYQTMGVFFRRHPPILFPTGGKLKKRLIVGTNLFQAIGFYCGNIKTIQGGMQIDILNE